MLLFGVLPTAAILVGIIVWLVLSLAGELRAANQNDMRMLATRVAAEIERGNTRAVLVAQVMAHAQQNGLFEPEDVPQEEEEEESMEGSSPVEEGRPWAWPRPRAPWRNRLQPVQSNRLRVLQGQQTHSG